MSKQPREFAVLAPFCIGVDQARALAAQFRQPQKQQETSFAPEKSSWFQARRSTTYGQICCGTRLLPQLMAWSAAYQRLVPPQHESISIVSTACLAFQHCGAANARFRSRQDTRTRFAKQKHVWPFFLTKTRDWYVKAFAVSREIICRNCGTSDNLQSDPRKSLPTHSC